MFWGNAYKRLKKEVLELSEYEQISDTSLEYEEGLKELMSFIDTI